MALVEFQFALRESGCRKGGRIGDAPLMNTTEASIDGTPRQLPRTLSITEITGTRVQMFRFAK
jgi:hypothetical protein